MHLPAFTLLLASLALSVSGQEFVYKFDPKYSAGIDGKVTVKYDNPKSTNAAITADINFHNADFDAIRKFDGNCTDATITEFKWHIHVKWPSDKTSDSFAQCAKPLTDEHYDPLKACGPFSEFATTDECKAKVKEYACDPDEYLIDPLACEKGDLSGKLGNLKLDKHKKASVKMVDPNFPRVEENTPEWNIMLHAVCGKVAPRIACAVIQEVGDKKHYLSDYKSEKQEDKDEEYEDDVESYEDEEEEEVDHEEEKYEEEEQDQYEDAEHEQEYEHSETPCPAKHSKKHQHHKVHVRVHSNHHQ